MPVGLVVVEKEAGGRTFRSTYALATLSLSSKITANASIEAFLGDLEVGGNMDAQTNPNDAGYVNEGDSASAVAAIIGFERLLSYTPTSFKRVYISDGKTNQEGVPGSGGPFASINLSGNGLRSTAGETPAPLSIVLGINRVPAEFSQRNGLLKLRMAINASDVTFGDDDGVLFINNTVELGYVTRIGLAVSSSGIDNFFGPLPEAPSVAPRIVIPKYEGKNQGTLPGQLLGGALVAGFSLREPMSFQVQAGRKRTT